MFMAFVNTGTIIFMGTASREGSPKVPIVDVKRFEKEVLEYFEVKNNEIFNTLKKEKVLSDNVESEIKKVAEEFASVFKKSN